MPRWLRVLPLALATATLSIITASCNSTSQAEVRFVHAIQDANGWISISTVRRSLPT